MPKAYCVTYDLGGDEGDYTGLYEVLKDSKRWWHYLESTWLVVVEGSVDELWERLLPHVTKADRLLVIDVTGDSQGLLPKKAWDWITRNVDAVESSVKEH
jgi:hypothetical protein